MSIHEGNYPKEFVDKQTRIELLCGNRAYLDPDSSIGAYICETCMTVVFSSGMPKQCKELYEKEKVWETLSK